MTIVLAITETETWSVPQALAGLVLLAIALLILWWFVTRP